MTALKFQESEGWGLLEVGEQGDWGGGGGRGGGGSRDIQHPGRLFGGPVDKGTIDTMPNKQCPTQDCSTATVTIIITMKQNESRNHTK